MPLSSHTAAPQRATTRPFPTARSARLPAGLLSLAVVTLAMAGMAASYANSGETVTLRVNGRTWQTNTHQRTIGAFLREAGLELRAEDIVVPPVDAPLAAFNTILVQKAVPVIIETDGHTITCYTHSHRLGDLLRELKLNARPYDVLTLDGEAVDVDAELPHYEWTPTRWPFLVKPASNPSGALAHSSDELLAAWTRCRLQRAVPLSITDNGIHTTIYTVARTIGEALQRQDILLYLGDRVQPALGTLLTSGMHAEIHRAKPVTVQVDGRTIRTRTQAVSVAQLLSETGVMLRGKDYAIPALNSEVTQDTAVRIVRVVEEWVLESQEIPFQTLWSADSNLELDQQSTERPGKPGARKRNVHIVYEDGVEKQRSVQDEWVERQPTTRIVHYGTRIVVRESQTPSGTVRYWRKVRMLATSYRASGVGKAPDHPDYGITRIGWKARTGIVAVDPSVINLRDNVYVPGYGLGVAADTGGKIKGRWIDLCYDEDNYVSWKRWVDVYVLEPVPPADQINWVLPTYPSERR